MLASGAGCADEGDPEDTGASSAAPAATASAEFAREADRICAAAVQEFASLADDLTTAPDDPDPLASGLIRPGAKIYASLAEELRALQDDDPQPTLVTTYLGYFEVIDALLAARLRVGEADGPPTSDRLELESRFQRVAGEQAVAASEAGLPGCAFDITRTIAGS